MDIKISDSTDVTNYEILIRKRGVNDYASYCPQLNYIIKGTAHEEVETKMQEHIKKHIENLQSKSVD